MKRTFGLAWGGQSQKYQPARRDSVFLVLAGLFVTHALLAELVGGKLIAVGGHLVSVGVIPWPLVFVATDLINEYYGPGAVRRLTLLTIGLILYAFVVVSLCMAPSAADVSPVSDEAFRMVFGQSLWIIVGSVIAFALSQLIDAAVFVLASASTRGRHLWLRAVGSTVASQLVDTFVVTAIAFGLPGKLSAPQVVEASLSNYAYKFAIALATLPLIYLGHGIVDRFLAAGHAPPRSSSGQELTPRQS